MRLYRLKPILVTALLIVSCSSFSQTNSTDQTQLNLVSAERWTAKADPYGSSVNYSAQGLFSGGAIQASMQQTQPLANKNWPFVELICQLPDNLEGSQGLTLKYKSSQPLHVKLSQTDFSHLGDQSYAHYAAIIPKSEQWQTLQLRLSDFEQPSWAPPKAKSVGLKLANIHDIYISPNFGAEGGEVDLAIETLQPH